MDKSANHKDLIKIKCNGLIQFINNMANSDYPAILNNKI